MKDKIFKLIFLVAIGFAFFSCSSSSDDSPYSDLEATPGTIGEFSDTLKAASQSLPSVRTSESDVVFFYYRPDGKYSDWDLYVWMTGKSGNSAGSFTSTVKQNGKTFAYVNLSTTSSLPDGVAEGLANSDAINFIVRKGGNNWKEKDPDCDRTFDTSACKTYLSISGDASVYFVNDDLSPSINSAIMLNTTQMQVKLSNKYALENSPSSNGFIITSDDNAETLIADVKNFEYKDSSDRKNNFTDNLFIELSGSLDFTKRWYIKHEKFVPAKGCEVGTSLAGKESINDLKYEDDDLGLTFNTDGTANFKVWAPLASSVYLIMFSDKSKLENPLDSNSRCSEPDRTVKMIKSDVGVYSAEKVDVAGMKYYKYRITNSGVTYDVCDIYAKAASYEARAAQIIDINTDSNATYTGLTDSTWGTKSGYYNPFGNSGTVEKRYTDAVIYEMHIRDWSRLEVADSTGKFLDIANGSKVIDYIKSLGVTHVQILPSFEWAIYNTKTVTDNSAYNWGYNPYHYNVPESRYVTDFDANDGSKAVQDFRTLIAKLHEAGIAVNMDVVYNHTSGTGTGSLYDMTVPYYYYRLNADGTYSNGSGCGNETDSEAPMFRKYMIDSLKHWMLDYHINGFRFDLMGLHDTETMKQIYKTLYEIDKNVMVYGEPWQGGQIPSPLKNDVRKDNVDTCSDLNVNGVAFFNDEFRNAIKGSEYPSFALGQASTNNCSVALNLHFNGKRRTQKIGRSINYVECHDNLTLADKLALVMNEKIKPEAGNWVGVTGENIDGVIKQGKLPELILRDKLAASYMFLAQGTPFINGGQEFLRSKKGDENSYESSDDINEIKAKYITEYSSVTDYYKGLIKLRKAYPENFGYCENVTVENLGSNGLVQKYDTANFIVYFNADNNEYSIPTDKQTEGFVVEINTGSVVVAAEKTKPTSIPKLSTLIVKVK